MRNVQRMEGIDRGLASEINFAITKFRELPEEQRRSLAREILDNPTDSEPFAKAGIKVYELLLDADSDEVTRYMNDVHCDGDQIFDFYMIAGSHSVKAARLTHFFREHLIVTDDECNVPEMETGETASA